MEKYQHLKIDPETEDIVTALRQFHKDHSDRELQQLVGRQMYRDMKRMSAMKKVGMGTAIEIVVKLHNFIAE